MTKAVRLTAEQAKQAREFYSFGARIRSIARKLRASEDAVSDAIFGAPPAARRAQIQASQTVRPPAEVLAERDRRKSLERQSLTAIFCGDPLPGESALDQRTASPP